MYDERRRALISRELTRTYVASHNEWTIQCFIGHERFNFDHVILYTTHFTFSRPSFNLFTKQLFQEVIIISSDIYRDDNSFHV